MCPLLDKNNYHTRIMFRYYYRKTEVYVTLSTTDSLLTSTYYHVIKVAITTAITLPLLSLWLHYSYHFIAAINAISTITITVHYYCQCTTVPFFCAAMVSQLLLLLWLLLLLLPLHYPLTRPD